MNRLVGFLNSNPDLNDMEIMFGRIAAKEALRSDEVTKVGAIIYRDGKILATGYNKLSDGVNDEEFFLRDEDERVSYVIHAEVVALTNALKDGNCLDDATMIVVGKCPCCDCAKAIVNSGIRTILCPVPDANSKWVEHNKRAMRILNAGKIEVRTVEELSGIDIGLTCITKYIV